MLAELVECLHKAVQVLGSGGVHKFGTVNIDTEVGGHLLCLFFAADEDEVGRSLLQDFGGGTDGALVLGLRKSNGLLILAGLFFDSFDKRHGDSS